MTTVRARARHRTDVAGVVGLVSAALLVATHRHRPGLLAVLLAVAVVAVDVSRVDLAARCIPNRSVALVLGAAAVGTSGSWLLADGTPGSMLAGLAVAGGPVLLFHLVSPAGMGFGDVKWSAALGAVVGLVAWPLALLVPLVGSLVAIVMAVATRERFVAFGPALAVGALVAVTVGPTWMGDLR